ncbi:MAG: hypothetical protein SVG88_06380 [Halobacteriales archaeon]|nr:hypothetical protein [Halobacteriales archaeon]
MTDEYATLGDCPECGRRLDAEQIMIEYTSDRGPSVTLAACPDCEDLVCPDSQE